jgi:hypothetical protein
LGEEGKRKNRSDQIRAPRCSCMFPSHQSLLTFSQNTPNKSTIEKKSQEREIKNCDVSRARFCDLEEFLYQLNRIFL